jgi:tRNA 2-selenouridine synthase
VAEIIDIHTFLLLSKNNPVIDVRSENEFSSGHIFSVHNIPVLSDQERIAVGTVFKQHGKQKAVLKGLELSGPYLAERLKTTIKRIGQNDPLVHCWRGGMRSSFFSYLLEFYGYKPKVLNGGYKTYRNFLLDYFETPFHFKVLGGKTGVNKTKVLHLLKKMGHQVIDLEGLANHKGSAFGGIGLGKQPTQEQFENNLFYELYQLDSKRPIWIENENRTIGDKVIPTAIWVQMMESDLVILEDTYTNRLQTIVADYGNLNIEDLQQAFEKINRRIGPQHYKSAIQDLEAGNIEGAFNYALNYYDKSYEFNLKKKGRVPNYTIEVQNKSLIQIVESLTSLL